MSLPSDPAPRPARAYEDAVPQPRLKATPALMALCSLIYVAMALLDPIPGDLLTPSTLAVQGFGGVNYGLIVGEGEWFRLLSHAFLHIGLIHFAANMLGFWIAGRLLEPLLGARAFVAVFVLTAAAGGLASISFNDPDITGAGASGGLMGLFGFALAFALRVPPGPYRSFLTRQALSVLIPTAIPAFLPFLSVPIDHAAHAGGALAGAVLALLSPLYWPVLLLPGRMRKSASFVLVIAACVAVWAVVALVQRWPEVEVQAGLIPSAELPRTDSAFRDRADALVRRYPDDPRAHFALSLRLAQQGNLAGAEQAARTAMERAERFPRIFQPAYRQQTRAFLALIQKDLNRLTDARATAAPLCTGPVEAAVRAGLDRAGLCPRTPQR